MEGFAREYFETMNEKSHEVRASMVGYKAILNSKATEESLVNFAKWEPHMVNLGTGTHGTNTLKSEV
ncbi:hypothetical protein C2S51_013195 [Perilla frutescens var. frutescens]|nr:hypothetical protein C2S51_013195 [Perilla frutescens var. frutescens]